MSPIDNSTPFPTRRLWRRERVWWLILGVVVVTAAAFTLHTRVNWTTLHHWLLQLSPSATIAAMALLPLAGFSIVAVDVIAGAKFGFWTGAGLIAGVTAFHLLASHFIARKLFRAPLQRFLSRHHERLPRLAVPDEYGLSVLIALVPGPPYFARNYMLALSEVPLRIYFWIVGPLYLLRALVTLAVGDLTGEMSRKKLLILGTVYLVKLIICAVVVKRLLAQPKAKPVPACPNFDSKT